MSKSSQESIRFYFKLAIQIMFVYFLAIALPLYTYFALGSKGPQVANILYIYLVITLVFSTILSWHEASLALQHSKVKKIPTTYPDASALIAAYLPNEADTIIDTIKSFLEINYDANLQIILSYNTPNPLPIESKLKKIEESWPNFKLIKVKNSNSKAENVNAALELVTGEFVGIFDADHHPEKDSFKKAWQWLYNGYDVVQGRCVIRNGNYSWLTKIIAIEFEMIYGLNHPGRNLLHGFGIFGGSNGYWRSSLIKAIKMSPHRLTEDIDASMRAVLAGHTIASDPDLISRELAPISFKALWNQRLRWAQGWFQVSRKYQAKSLRAISLTNHQKLGQLHLFTWREIFPWVSIQIVPVIIYYIVTNKDKELDFFIPILLLTTIFTILNGIRQLIITFKLSSHDSRLHKSWYFLFYLSSLLFYSRMKDIISMIGHFNEFVGKKEWRVTPRIG